MYLYHVACTYDCLPILVPDPYHVLILLLVVSLIHCNSQNYLLYTISYSVKSVPYREFLGWAVQYNLPTLQDTEQHIALFYFITKIVHTMD